MQATKFTSMYVNLLCLLPLYKFTRIYFQRILQNNSECCLADLRCCCSSDHCHPPGICSHPSHASHAWVRGSDFVAQFERPKGPKLRLILAWFDAAHLAKYVTQIRYLKPTPNANQCSIQVPALKVFIFSRRIYMRKCSLTRT